jgi:hypothetical protein
MCWIAYAVFIAFIAAGFAALFGLTRELRSVFCRKWPTPAEQPNRRTR